MIECDNFELENGFYLNLMHSLSVTALLINLFAIYCIVCKSTKQMGPYKWYLFAYQIASTAFDLVYTGLTLPVIFFPIPMGYPGAWIAQWLSISSHAAVISVVLTCSLLVATILNLFNYRCHLVTPNYHILKINAKGHVYTSTAMFIIYFISCLAGIIDILPDQNEAKKWALQEYSCAESAIHVPHLTVFILSKVKRIVMTVVALAILALVLCVVWISLTINFIGGSGHLSEKTRQMQRRFLIYLCIQVAVPAFTMLVPILILTYVFGSTNNTQRDLGNAACALVASHGCVAALSLIMCNEPYRRFVTLHVINVWKRRKTLPAAPEFTQSVQHQTSRAVLPINS